MKVISSDKTNAEDEKAVNSKLEVISDHASNVSEKTSRKTTHSGADEAYSLHIKGLQAKGRKVCMCGK